MKKHVIQYNIVLAYCGINNLTSEFYGTEE